MKKINQISQPKVKTVFSQVLRKLMVECDIIEAELARQTGLPQTTINRLLLGETGDPRAATLVPIAKYFSITVGQLLGEEPLNPKRIKGTTNPNNRTGWNIIPIIDWKDAKSWTFSKNKYTPNNHKNWITTERESSSESFALKTLEFMAPRFRNNSIIIVDPTYSFKDGNYVIISINSADATVRRITIDGSEILLRKLYGNDEPQKLTKSDTIIGTITETRINEK